MKRLPAIDWSKYTPFQKKVLQAICRIPKGKVWTYKQVAEKIGSPGAARAVGGALAANQDAPTVPCHRVVASDGSLGGYSGRGGVKGKLKLLKLEGAL
ncbi:MAG: MGMT family protein [Candidatus Saccharibacteria bacterium]